MRSTDTPKRKKLYGADLFCGAGGTSQGLLMAANDINVDLELIAVNHWQTAIDTHTVNHPYAKNLCTGLDEVDPLKLVPGRRLHILCASPECTHHSVARGGKPMDDQSRSSPQLILRWMQLLYIDNVIIENVPEFQSWGPLGVDNRPLKSKKGHLFNAWVEMIRAMDYRVEWRVLNCADFGAPTTRRRLFMICRRNNKKIVWPEPSHVSAATYAKRNQTGLFTETRLPWRTAREIIDWARSSQCIFDRKRPLAPNTQRRIQAGLRKFSGIDLNIGKCYAEGLRPYLLVPPGGSVKEAQAFLLPHRGKDPNQSVEDPFRTVTATSSDFALVEPFLMTIDHTGGSSPSVRSADEPVTTLVTKANAAVCEPFLIGQQSDAAPRHSAEPVPTIATAGAISLTEPHIIPQFGTAGAASVDKPLGVVTTTSGGGGLAEPFLAIMRGTSNASPIDAPLTAVTSSGNHHAAVQPFMVPNFGERDGQASRTHSVNAPVPAVTGHGAGGVVEPFLTTVGGATGQSRNPQSVDYPLGAVLTNDRRAVAEPFLSRFQGSHAGREDGEKRNASLDEPITTLDTSNRFGLAEPFLATINHGEGLDRRVRSVDQPMATVTGSIGEAVVEPFIATVTHTGGDRVRSIDLPLATVTRSMGDGVAAPALVSYYGATQNMSSVDEPTPTVTTKDRFGLMQPGIVFEQLLAEGWTMYRLEVRFRMLQPRELARAQGFDDGYQFTGNREAVVKQIGNAVPPPMARALCGVVIA